MNPQELIDRLLRPRLWSLAQELNRSQWLPRPELVALQNEKLVRLLRHAAANVPHYRDFFLLENPMPTLANLHTAPILTREDLQLRGERLVAANIPASMRQAQHSGGTTGEPVWFQLGLNLRVISRAFERRSDYSWTNTPFHAPKAVLWSRPSYEKKRRIKSLSQMLGRRRQFMMHRVTGEDMARLAKDLAAFRPGIILGYASAIHRMAQWLLVAGCASVRPNAVLSTAESLSDDMRGDMTAAFGCRVFDRYATREFGIIAAECDHGRLHVNAERFIVEIADSGGNLLPAGKPGDILITDLDNDVFPFIRYRVGDVGFLTGEECPCGRQLPVMGRIIGRSTEYVRFADGGRMMFAPLFKPFRNQPPGHVRQTQLVQVSLEELEVRLIPGPGYSDATEQRLREALAEYIEGTGLRLTFRLVNEIPPAPSGKVQFFVSQL